MVVLRESERANRQDEILQPTGRAWGTLASGEKFEFFPAWYEYIGDMHIRFVFDEAASMVGLSVEELSKFNLTPTDAVRIAMSNIGRVYGPPMAKPWQGHLMTVEGKCPDLDSSYFLARDFWRDLLVRYPEGIVAGVPKRGGLIFAPLTATSDVDLLRSRIGWLYSTSENQRVSSALYLFKGDQWTVFQAPATMAE